MFKHEIQLFNPVEVERTNPHYALLMREQLGGSNGELNSAMQYMAQSFKAKDTFIKDLLMDIATEELNHLEMVATIVNLLSGYDVDMDDGKKDAVFGLSPGIVNSSGCPWNFDSVSATGDLYADLISDIASEQRSKAVYEYLFKQINDKKVRSAIDFLLERETFHEKKLCEAIDRLKKEAPRKNYRFSKDSELCFSILSAKSVEL
ncbi:MAG: manganese catalase family protein [Clostridia bacterium]|nr:manganese catalase family protein [Clostridia bacterium]